MSYKDNTNEVILEAYDEKGFSYAVDLSRKILESNYAREKAGIHARNVVVGQIAETVLEMAILEYVRLNPAKTEGWLYSKGLILKDMLNPNSRFLTEIDLVLFTPAKIFLFESKSYNGDKKIVDKGEIVRSKGRRFDVFNQHSNHAAVFASTFSRFKLPSIEDTVAYQLAAFDFSVGKFEDLRDTSWRKFFPFVNVNTVFRLLDQSKPGVKVWDMRYVAKAVDLIEKKKDHYTAEHLNYVKSLHRGK